MKYFAPHVNPERQIDVDYEAFVSAVNHQIRQLGGIPTEQNEQLHNFMDDMKAILEDTVTPLDYLPQLGHGSFKECYLPYGAAPFIIKFCSDNNRTDEEMDILSLAEEADVADFFIDTTFIRLNRNLPAEILSEDCEDHTSRYTYDPDNETYVEVEDYAYPELDFIELQPRLSAIASDHCGYIESALWYEQHPLKDADGTILPYEEIRRSGIDDYAWIRAAVQEYGIGRFLQLVHFIEENNIWDLHERNLGYIVKDNREVPVIIDWLS